MKTILSVVAHPDDEVLGFGATAAKFSQNGHQVFNCILSGKAEVRQFRPSDAELAADTTSSQEILGAHPPILGDFPNIRFNTVPHVELVQFIEKVIVEVRPDIIFTHFPYDLNNDHQQVSAACQAASRLFQRRSDVKPISALYFMEILSSTEWAFPVNANSFMPDTFVEVGKELIELKIKALNQYRGVMREYPHPRSVEVLTGLAAYRGAQAGMKYAEGFKTAFHNLQID